jgi:3-oxoadipate enol-lactonase
MRFRLSSGLALGYWTRGAGPVLALIHPIGLRAEFWRPIAEHLSSEFRVVAIDLRGHGESDVPSAGFSLDDAAADVAELLRALGQPPCIVGGCSMGGMVALGVAVRAPELVRGVILSNTAHTFTPQARAVMEERAQAAAAGMPAILEGTINRWFSPEFQQQNPELVTRVTGWLLEADPIVHGWSWRAIRDLDYGARMAQIKPPTLIVTGSDDKSIPPAIAEQMLQRLANGRHRDFPGAGHLTPLERPKEYADLLRAFAASLA